MAALNRRSSVAFKPETLAVFQVIIQIVERRSLFPVDPRFRRSAEELVVEAQAFA
jgi:hypothetical protein